MKCCSFTNPTRLSLTNKGEKPPTRTQVTQEKKTQLVHNDTIYYQGLGRNLANLERGKRTKGRPRLVVDQQQSKKKTFVGILTNIRAELFLAIEAHTEDRVKCTRIHIFLEFNNA